MACRISHPRGETSPDGPPQATSRVNSRTGLARGGIFYPSIVTIP